jgi:hypothetical protein
VGSIHFGQRGNQTQGEPRTGRIVENVMIFVDLRAFEAELWNDTCSEAHEPWRRLHVGCTILAVNGVSGNTKRMQIELETAREANWDGMNITAMSWLL